MNLTDLFEADYQHKWKYTDRNETPCYSLETDYGRGFQYTATFVFGREDHFEFFKQGATSHGDRVEFGTARTTPRKSFNSAKDLNKFLVAQKLPELSEAELNKLHPDDVIFIGISEGTDHFFRITLDDLQEIKKRNDSIEAFIEDVRKSVKRVIKKNDWLMRGDKFRPQTERALKAFYESGTRPKPTI